uniref:Peptidase S1 domain-containing protein n=3 Tax=Photinus pyralis TaxID=7054 RepID=A0A1Y1LCA4_PHOPY
MSSLLPDKYDCGQSSAEKIFGGEVADMFDFPWIALIKYKTLDGYGFHCGGSLINTRYVLTAAHCLIGKDLPEAVSVRLGEYNLELDLDCTSTPEYPMCADKHIDIPIAEMVVHEHYRPFDDNQYNDIALLRLARDIPYTDFIKPVCLPIYPNLINEYFVGTNATTAGWGRTETQRSGSSIKMKVTLPVRSNLDCKDVYASRRVSLSTQQLCVGGESGKDSCKGDSGGPLMHLYTAPGEINWYIIGIVSFGPQICGLNGWPSVYTRVTEYVPWILQHLRP